MAFRYLIYSTGTTYATTIVRESATNNPGVNEASYYTDFLIPEIQPLYLWRVNNEITPTNVIPNIDSNINNYEAATAPPPQPDDSITYGEVTGITDTKIDKVAGVTGKIPVFTANGNLQNSGYTPAELIASGSGVTTSTFAHYTGVTAPSQFASKAFAFTGITTSGSGTTLINNTLNRVATFKSVSGVGGVKILVGNSANLIISGETNATPSWGSIIGTLSNQTDLWTALTGKTSNVVFNLYTGTTAPATYQTIANVSYFTGTTLPANYYNKSQINSYSAQTLININSRLLTSTFATYTGTTIPNTYYNKSQINSYTGQTAALINNKVTKVTGVTGNIVTFAAAGAIQDSAKTFITTVNSAGVATNAYVPTELAVRNAINQAVAAAIILQGDWNATTNTPDLTVTGITTGFAWRVSVSGTTNLGGITLWAVGDMAVKAAGLNNWIRVSSQDIAAIWGNIYGSISNQTDLQNALNAKQNTITGAATSITGNNLTINRALISNALGKVAVSTITSTELGYLSGVTSNIQPQINSKLSTSTFNSYSASTQSQINSKLSTSVFTGYTASTKNKDKKIQVVSTIAGNVNLVTPTGITWTSAPFSADTYLWAATTANTVYIKSAGDYEVQYHVLLKNSTANQTHSVGGYIVKNGSTVPLTATAAMIVGPSASGELSFPPAILTLANNDRLQLALFRIGSTGTVNTVNGSTFMTINKLT
jgi:hypothetical protein